MAIQMLSGILAHQATKDKDGHYHIIDPVTPVAVPVAWRQTPPQGIQLPVTVAILYLWNGSPGPFQLTTSIVFPDGEERPANTQDVTWRDGASHMRILEYLDMKLDFRGIGVYAIRFSIDNQVIGQLPIVLHWEDDPHFINP